MASPERDKEQSQRGAERFRKDNTHATLGRVGQSGRQLPAPVRGCCRCVRGGSVRTGRRRAGPSPFCLSVSSFQNKQKNPIKKSLILPFCSVFCGNRLQALQATTNFNYSQHLSDAFSVIQKCKATVLAYKCLDFICNSHIQVSSEARGLSRLK